MPAYDATLFDPPAPLARVAARNPRGGDILREVAMLVDSGADVSLIPRAAVERLGLDVDPGEAYELMGFDGHTSLAPAVQLELIFLGRAFKGRFLVIDRPWGILGRDILNEVSLGLDGPRLVWNELAGDREGADRAQ